MAWRTSMSGSAKTAEKLDYDDTGGFDSEDQANRALEAAQKALEVDSGGRRADWDDEVQKGLKDLRDSGKDSKDKSVTMSHMRYPLAAQAVLSFTAAALPLLSADGEFAKGRALGEDDADPEELSTDESGEIDVQGGKPRTRKEARNAEVSEVVDGVNARLRGDGFGATLESAIYSTAATGLYALKVDSESGFISGIAQRDFWIEQGIPWDEAQRAHHRALVSRAEELERYDSGEWEPPEEWDPESDDAESKLSRLEVIESHMPFDFAGDGRRLEPAIITWATDRGRDLEADDNAPSVGGRLLAIRRSDSMIQDVFFPLSILPALPGDLPMGLPVLLRHVTDATSQIANQIMDSATLANKVGGFLSTQSMIGAGRLKYTAGDFIQVNTAPEVLSKAFTPIPFNPIPSALDGLLGKTEQWGREMGSIATVTTENFPSGMSGATALALVESGLSGFKDMYKRLARQIGRALNRASKVGGAPDWIEITADENASGVMERAQKAQFYLDLLTNPAIDPAEATRRALEEIGEDDIDSLMAKPPSGPNPVAMLEMERLKAEIEKLKADAAKSLAAAAVAPEESRARLVDRQSEAVKRGAQSIEALSRAERNLETPNDNPEYVRQLSEVSRLATGGKGPATVAESGNPAIEIIGRPMKGMEGGNPNGNG